MLKPGKPASKLTKSDSSTASEPHDMISLAATLQSDHSISNVVSVLA